MADTKIKMVISWENQKSFHVTIKEDNGDTLDLVKMDENGCIMALWPAMTDIMERYTRSLMQRIGEEMALP